MDKTIGILALGKAENYGAVLQSYSLCKYIRKNICNAEIIDYTPDFLKGNYPLIIVEKGNVYTALRSLVESFLRLKGKLEKKAKFRNFRRRDSLYSSKKFERLTDRDYFNYIVGSDQVFNVELTNYDEMFFLPDVVDIGKKHTYAASLGVSSLSEKSKNFLKEKLNSFQLISVREKTGVELLKELFPDKEIICSLDPVFLTSKEEWNEIIETELADEYILIYTFKSFEKALNIAKKIDAQCKIFHINDDFRTISNGVYNINGVGPEQFLRLIRDAKYVITDSFHGTAFSIIFQKDFYCIPYVGTESRFYDMLSYFNIEDRIINCDDKFEIKKTINYREVEMKIVQNNKLAAEYLNRVIEDNRGEL